MKDLPQTPSSGSPAADRWALVEQRLKACQQQYKIPVATDVPPRQPQPRMSLQRGSFASRKVIKKTTAYGVNGLNLGPRACHLAQCARL
ncbi:g10752 [Coccomyxa elongata]